MTIKFYSLFLHFAEISTSHFYGYRSAHRRLRIVIEPHRSLKMYKINSDEEVETEQSDYDIAADPDYINSNDEGEEFFMI